MHIGMHIRRRYANIKTSGFRERTTQRERKTRPHPTRSKPHPRKVQEPSRRVSGAVSPWSIGVSAPPLVGESKLLSTSLQRRLGRGPPELRVLRQRPPQPPFNLMRERRCTGCEHLEVSPLQQHRKETYRPPEHARVGSCGPGQFGSSANSCAPPLGESRVPSTVCACRCRDEVERCTGGRSALVIICQP